MANEIATHEVRLDVSALTGAAWDKWCATNIDSDHIEGCGVQRANEELWLVKGSSESEVRDRVETAIAGADVTIISVRAVASMKAVLEEV